MIQPWSPSSAPPCPLNSSELLSFGSLSSHVPLFHHLPLPLLQLTSFVTARWLHLPLPPFVFLGRYDESLITPTLPALFQLNLLLQRRLQIWPPQDTLVLLSFVSRFKVRTHYLYLLVFTSHPRAGLKLRSFWVLSISFANFHNGRLQQVLLAAFPHPSSISSIIFEAVERIVTWIVVFCWLFI